MIRLFRSFDFKFFQYSLYFYIFFLALLRQYFSKFNKVSFLIIKLNLIFQDFLERIKSKRFSKTTSLLIISLFLIIFYFNFSSVFSFNFPLTSQVSLCILFALSMWVSFLLFQTTKNIKGFIFHNIPEGTPIYLTWFLFLIELVRNFIRPITLMVRLVANILAGHLLMILLSRLVLSNFLILPIYLLLNGVEIFVSLIQAYIFITMVSLYYSELN